MKRRVLVFTVDVVPLPGAAAYGGGLRAWGLGQALAGAGHEIVYSVPKERLEGLANVPGEIAKNAFTARSIDEIVNANDPDVLLFEQWGLLDFLKTEGIPTVVDLHGSLILENSFRGQLNWSVNAEAKVRCLRKADLVLVPGRRQAEYFKPWLMLAGENPKTLPIAVVPVSMPPEPPKPGAKKRSGPRARSRQDGPVFVHGGNLWPWIDPLPSLEVVAATLERRKTGKLLLFTGQPVRFGVLPQEPSATGPAKSRLAGVEAHDRVEQRGFRPRDELLEEYLAATVAVDVYRRNAERELAITTRTIEYLWCGLPVIYSDYAELSPILAEAGAGWIVDPDDTNAVKAIVEAVIEKPELAQDKGEAARKLVAERFSWDKTVGPLAAFVADPVRRGKGRAIFSLLEAELQGLKREWEGKREDLQNAVKEISRDNAQLNATIEDLRMELRRKNEDLLKVSQSASDLSSGGEAKVLRETAWRDDEIRRLRQEKADECKLRDEELRRRALEVEQVRAGLQGQLDEKLRDLKLLEREKNKELEKRDRQHEKSQERLEREVAKRDESLALSARKLEEQSARSQDELRARAEELRLAKQELAQEIKKRDEKLERLQEQMTEDVRRRDDEIKSLNLERARDIRDLNDELKLRDQRVADLQSDVRDLTAERSELDRELACAIERAAAGEKQIEETRLAMRQEMLKVEAERARLQTELETHLDLERSLEESARQARDAVDAVELERARLQEGIEQHAAQLEEEVRKLADTEAAREELRLALERTVAERDALRELADERMNAISRGELEHGEAAAAWTREQDELRAELSQERHGAIRLRNEHEQELAALGAERDSQRQAADRLQADLDQTLAHVKNLETGLAAREDRIRWLENVNFGLKNRFPNKSWEFSTYWAKRILLQYPLLIGLYVLNFVSNVYMHWWTQRHRQQVFPGM